MVNKNMDFMPLLMMLNGMNKDSTGKNGSLGSMIDGLNKAQNLSSGGSSMDMMMNMLGSQNPEMKNAMQMAQMMSKMNSGGNKSSATNEKAEEKKPQESTWQSSTAKPQYEQKKSEAQESSNPLKPITKIANKDITYMLNRYIND